MSLLPTFSSDRERTFWVQARLKLLNTSFAAIARENSWSRNTVRGAMFMALDAQERAIAEKLGVTQQALFPERYDAEGNRLHAVKNTPQRGTHNVNKREAA
jgi:Ner family transcriptional regulator